MNYTASHAYEQLEFDFSAPSYLLIPSALPGFRNTDTKRYNSVSGAVVYLMRGSQDTLPEELSAPRAVLLCMCTATGRLSFPIFGSAMH